MRGSGYLAIVEKPQREALAKPFLDLHHQIDLGNAIFWGLWLIPFGLLDYRSHLLPRFLAVWLILACFGWLAFSFRGFLHPGLEDRAYTWGQSLLLGEIATILWLALMGAKEPRKVVPK